MNNQPEQHNQPEQQQSGAREQRNQNGGRFSRLAGLFFPLPFNLGRRQQEENIPSGGGRQENNNERQTSSPINNEASTSPQTENNNSQQNGAQAQPEQIPQFHFFIYPMPTTQEGGNGQTTPGIFFFAPFFMPQEVQKPRASESAMKKLPIVTITKEHIEAQASCPICFDHFSLTVGDISTNQHEPVRQMPCNHMFCESCLFQWLRQNNSCPLCRKEIEAEGTEAQQHIINPTPPSPPSPPRSTTSNDTTTNATQSTSLNSQSQSQSQSHSCALANVGCCEEINNNTPAPIITLPQCHHRFHASCLRTSLLVEGYSPGEFNSISQPLDFHCPTCRAPAIVQSDMLKMPAAPNASAVSPQDEGQQVVPFNLPLTIHMPDLDDMDLD